MDVQDHTIPSGHESHGVHLCHRCGWPFPNPHPSAKHRRAHKKICGTIEGYTNLIDSEVVSDDDSEKTPSPKTEKKMIIGGDGDGSGGGGGGGIRGSFSRSEDELFSDAVTEFSDSVSGAGSVHKTLDRDLFYSFKDAENGGTNEEFTASMEKIEESEIKTVCDSSESNVELNKTDVLVKDEVVEGLEAGEEKGKKSQASEIVAEEAKDSEMSKTMSEVSVMTEEIEIEKFVSATADEFSDEIRQEIKSKHVSEVKESETVEGAEETREEIKHEKMELDHKLTPESVKESKIDQLWVVNEEIKHEKFESDDDHASKVAKESEIDENISVLNKKEDLGAPNELIQEDIKETVAVSTEKKGFGVTELGESSKEQIQEVVKEPDTVLTEKEDFGAPEFGKSSKEQIQEVLKEPNTILTEKRNLVAPELGESSKEQIQEAVKEPDTVLTEKEDFGAPEFGKSSKEQSQEVVKEPNTIVTEKRDLGAPELGKSSKEQIQEVVKEPDTVLIENEDYGAPESGKSSKDDNQEVVKEADTILIKKEDIGAPEFGKTSKLDTLWTENNDLGAPELGKSSKEQNEEVVKEPDTILNGKEDIGAPELEKTSKPDPFLTEKNIGAPKLEKSSEPDTILIEKDLGAPKLEESSEEQIQEAGKETVTILTEKPDTVLTEKEDPGAPIKELIQEAEKEPDTILAEKTDTILTEKEDFDASKLGKGSKEHIQEVVKEPYTILTKKEDIGASESEKCSKEQIQVVVKEPDTVLTEIGAPNLGEHSNKHNHEVYENPDSILTEKLEDLGAPDLEKRPKENIVEEPNPALIVNQNLGAPESKESNHEVITEQKVDNVSNVVADVGIQTMTLKVSSDNSKTNSKNSSDVVPEPDVEGNTKQMNNQDSGAALSVDSSSRNSLEGNWGSVSVLSTASVDAETSHSTVKSKVNNGKSVAADDFEPPSFMTLVEPERKDQKLGSSEVVQDSSKQPPNPKAGWFPTLTKVNNESEGRKKNEEAIAKVTNWTTGRQSTPLKNLLGEAKSPNVKQPEPSGQKDETDNEKAGQPCEDSSANHDISSPPKLIDDGKKGRKKGRSSWAPFVCCSSVNVVN